MSYSSFFSSGLSAIQHLTPPPSPTQPDRPDSPIVPPIHSHEETDIITDEDPIHAVANTPQPFGSEKPKLRKRRSSLTVNTSPLVQFKGSYRGATTAIQKQNRGRSGSVNEFSQPRSTGSASEESNIIGRPRSGSIGNSLRSRRIVRGARPPPSTPLPPLPALPFPAPNLGGFNLGVGYPRRRPLVYRLSTTENFEHTIPSSSTTLRELNTGPPFKPVVNGPEEVVMKDN